MRSEKEMYQLIDEVAKEIHVKAIAMSGSRVNCHIPKDQYQDYDVVYIVEDKERLLKNRQWLERFGPQLIMQTPEEMQLFPAGMGERFTFLMLFEDGNRIDLTLCPVEAIDDWLSEEPMVDVLFDPEQLLSGKTSLSDQSYQTSPVNQVVFSDCCNEFWWVSTYVIKGILRKERIYAIDHLYSICQYELLRLLSWQVVLEKGPLNLGKNYKYLFHHLDDKKEQYFSKLLDFSTLEKISEALINTQNYFQKEAQIIAQQTGFHYDLETAEKIMNRTKKQLAMFLKRANTE